MRTALIWFAACAFAVLIGSVSAQQSIVRGRQYYVRYCAPCHGNEADGRGPTRPGVTRRDRLVRVG